MSKPLSAASPRRGPRTPRRLAWLRLAGIGTCLASFATFELHRRALSALAPWPSPPASDAPPADPPVDRGLNGSVAPASDAPPIDPPVDLGLNGSVAFPPAPPLADPPPPDLPRTLLYVTTLMNAHHVAQLRTCWPPALRRSAVLNSTDVLVQFVRQDPPAAGRAAREWTEHGRMAVRELRRAFRGRNLTIRARRNEGYQEGAASAVTDAAREGWWDGYDWVVRLNPDLIIRDEAPLRRAMAPGSDKDGVFVNCDSRDRTNERYLAHTDFFAVRVSAIADSPYLARTANKAEAQWTNVVRDPIIKKGRAVWLDGSRPGKSVCRAAQDGGPWEQAPVVHTHLKDENGTCPIPFD